MRFCECLDLLADPLGGVLIRGCDIQQVLECPGGGVAGAILTLEGAGELDVGGQQDVTGRQRAGAGDGIFEFAHVTRPAVVFEVIQRLRAEAEWRHAIAFDGEVEEVVGE